MDRYFMPRRLQWDGHVRRIGEQVHQSGFTPIFRCMTFLVVFGAVSVAPHSGGHVLVYVRDASPLAQAASTQSQ